MLSDIGRLEVREVPSPETGPHDVLIRVSAVGLCGTDFHIFEGNANYHTDSHGRPIPLTSHPQILGHEVAGVVVETGREVTDLQIGDRVVIDQGLNCLSERRRPLCEYCATGDSHQCESYREHGITGLQGGLADLIAIPAVNAIRIDSDLEFGEAALTEPLGCIVHSFDAAQRSRARYAITRQQLDGRVRSVLICGAGPAGLLFLQYLRTVLGYDGLLVVAEPNTQKRALAADFGASIVDPSSDDLVEAVQEMTGGKRVEYLIEAAGAATLFPQIPGLLRKQGTLMLYGHGHSGIDLGVLNNIQFLEPTLVAAVGASGGYDDDGRPSTYRKALGLIEKGTIRVSPFITHRYHSLNSVAAAFTGEHRGAEYVKGVVLLNEAHG